MEHVVGIRRYPEVALRALLEERLPRGAALSGKITIRKEAHGYLWIETADAAQVLLLAGAFPDEDDGRGAWSDAEHDAVARGSKAAARAARAGRAQGIELIHGGPPCPDGLPDGARAWRAFLRGGG